MLAILMLVIVGNGLYRLHLINEHLDLIVHNHNYKLQLANTMHEALLVRRSGLYIYAGLEDEFERLEEWERFNEAASTYLTARSTLLSMQLTEEERGMLKQLDSLTQTGQPIQLQVISLVNSDELEAAKQQVILDVTIIYPDGRASLWKFLSGQVSRIVMRVEQVDIPQEFLQGDYMDDPVFRKQFQTWVRELWHSKDALIERTLQETHTHV